MSNLLGWNRCAICYPLDVTIKFSTNMFSFAELRTKIDHLRIERARYDLLYKKLDRTLTELRRDNALLMESATAAFNIRSVGDNLFPLLLLYARTYLFLEILQERFYSESSTSVQVESPQNIEFRQALYIQIMFMRLLHSYN